MPIFVHEGISEEQTLRYRPLLATNPNSLACPTLATYPAVFPRRDSPGFIDLVPCRPTAADSHQATQLSASSLIDNPQQEAYAQQHAGRATLHRLAVSAWAGATILPNSQLG